MDSSKGSSHSEVYDILGQITIYSISGCPHCAASKKLLTKLGLPYVDVNLNTYPSRRDEMVKLTDKHTVPQIFFNSKHVGGNAELQKLYKDDKLSSLIDLVTGMEPDEDTPSPPGVDEAAEQEDEELDIVCELDHHHALAQRMRVSVGVKTRHYHMRNYKKCFVGSKAVDWLISNVPEVSTRQEAVDLGNELLEKHLFSHVCFEHGFKDEKLYYRFIEDEGTRSLNTDEVSSCDPLSASDISTKMRKLILRLYDDFLSEDGKHVDYAGIGKCDEWKMYLRLARELQRIDVTSLTREEKLAFFINIYNALVIHATVEIGSPSNVYHRYRFFNRVSYRIGGLDYNLQQIENGILRGNKRGVGALRKPFRGRDARRAFCIRHGEPRVHFALVCGAKSCPAIKTYSSDHIYEELDSSAMGFFADDSNLLIDVGQNKVKLNMILKWYSIDFGKSTDEILTFISGFLSGDRKSQMEGLIGAGAKISYFKYDWASNS